MKLLKKFLKILSVFWLVIVALQFALWFGDDTSLLGFPGCYLPFNEKYIFPVAGASMEPTIQNGEYVFYNSFDKELEPGKIMSMQLNLYNIETGQMDDFGGQSWVKRIKEVKSDGCIWIEGDNTPEFSSDSREWGWLCPENYSIQGTVMFK